ncbi:hypothetical protein ACSS1H_00955 [Acinetobacter baumannii]|uniref:hypothetical protein n=1 Tax=Acinetobacter baumannii TaxID=470 RepID=UPI002940C087|nr:hypothetical protein [Acinetobacter baumannii]MDV4292767.1 hypothetical protein [Acinetobacter baumannii]HAV5546665.1 hypothetical protein [Acinetobacter baumannii]
MPVTLIQAFQQIIKSDYRLKKSGNMFEIEETSRSSTNKFLKIGGSQGFGFTLDKEGGHPWEFIVNGPLEGIVSVCDGIIVLNYENNNYILVLDLKSKNAGAKAFKQVFAGIYLCEWLCSLLKLNKHLREPFKFIGIVCKTRGSVAKTTSRKGLNAQVNNDNEIPLIIVSNPGVIHIKDLIPLVRSS